MPPVLALPRLNGKFTINTDTCDTQVGCVLLQEKEDKVLKPISYGSRSLCDAEIMYDTNHKECLAVVQAVLLLRPYLERSHFGIRTDQQALRWTLDLKESNGRRAWWKLRLMEFDFEIVHLPPLYQQAADAMYRLPKVDRKLVGEADDVEDDIPSYRILGQESEALWATEEDRVTSLPISTSEELLEAQQMNSCCRNVVKLVGIDTQFAMDENVLLYQKAPIDGPVQVIVTDIFCQAILYNGHHPILAGLPGTCQIYDELQRHFNWPHMAADVQSYVSSCK